MQNSTAIRHGDIFIEASGSSHMDGQDHTLYSMFEFDAMLDKGAGRIYSPSGEATHYYWAHPKIENRFDNVPSDILFSFQHGIWNFKAPSSISLNDGMENLIRNSDFQFLTKEYVEFSKQLSGIKTLDEIRTNWPMIKKHKRATAQIATVCLEAIGLEIPPPRNGEIGIHQAILFSYFTELFVQIEKDLGLV